MRDDALRLSDMLESIERIRTFVAGGRAAFFTDDKTHGAVAFEVLKLGEAASAISSGFRKTHPSVSWKHLVNLRNSIVHEYLRLDLDALWEFASHEIDGLERDRRKLPR